MKRPPDYTGERYTPWDSRCGRHVAVPHIRRYAWATQFAYDRWVVDLGCGVGYGSFMLSWVSRQVTGVDISQESVDYASEVYGGQISNLSYEQLDLMGPHTDQIMRLQAMGDLFVAFEVLEHLPEPAMTIKRFVPLVWSMPVNDPSNFHYRPYALDEILSMLPGRHWGQTADGDIAPLALIPEPKYVLGLTLREEL